MRQVARDGRMLWLGAAVFAVAIGGAGACGDDPPPVDPVGVGAGGDGVGGDGQGGDGGQGGEPPLQDCDALGEALQATLDESLAAEKAANPSRRGGTAGVVITPHCRWTGATGESGLGESLKPNALFRIGSVTKTYTAAAVLHAANEGLLDLDDPLSSFVTAGVMYEEEITVRQLLNHTSGVRDFFADPAFIDQIFANPNDPVLPQELIDVAIGLGPEFEPGQGWGYANTNYVLLALVLEAATGQSYHGYLRSSLLEPLGLERTFLPGTDDIEEALAVGWYGTSLMTDAIHPTVAWAAGDVVADVDDLGDWIYALVVDDVVAAPLKEEMLDFLPVGNPSLGLGYGLGVFTFVDAEVGMAVGHDGALPGYETEVYWIPGAEVLVGIITNNRQSDDGEVWSALAATAVALTPTGD